MYKSIILLLVVSVMVSCGNTASKNKFTVSGVITNNTARMIYLEEVPAATMQPMLVDSVLVGKDGKFSLQAVPKESVVFNLRLDRNIYPVASVINDVPGVTMDIKLDKGNSQFAETYEVKGSPASQQMKEFMVGFNNDLKKIFINSRQTDSLRNTGAADSILFPLMAEKGAIAGEIKKYSEQALGRANNPALFLFELGYYQATANANRFGLPPFTDEQVIELVSKQASRFPSHQGLAAINTQLLQQAKEQQEQRQRKAASSRVGKPAPDFALPDVNGKEVKLSSFRGKYVLVDFWASWCQPCRMENPTVVQAWQQYKDKNFTVLGVSLDRPGQKDEWLKAIKEDQLDWTQVSDLQFWNSAVIPLYGLEGIPFNVLVDPAGKVIAEDLRGPALQAMLSKVLK